MSPMAECGLPPEPEKGRWVRDQNGLAWFRPTDNYWVRKNETPIKWAQLVSDHGPLRLAWDTLQEVPMDVQVTTAAGDYVWGCGEMCEVDHSDAAPFTAVKPLERQHD